MFAKRIYLTLVSTALLALWSAIASAQSATLGAASSPLLEGTWVVTVDLMSPSPGLAEEFTSLETYSRGGGMITSNNMRLGPGQGSWERNDNQYTVTILFFTFDASGAQNGSIKVRHNISLNGKNKYSGHGVAEVSDTAGNLLSSISFNTEGHRLVPAAP